MAKVNLSAPWVEYYNQMNKLFGEDPDIKIIFDEENYAIKLYVKGEVKANAIQQLIPESVEFGNITVTNSVIPENVEFDSDKAIIDAAFKGNPVFSYSKSVDGLYSFNATYAVFKNKVVQYFNDNLNDINGNKSTLYENIAREILTNSKVFFCTDVEQ